MTALEIIDENPARRFPAAETVGNSLGLMYKLA